MYQEECRICDGELVDKFSLGNLYPSGFMKPGEQWPDKASLTLTECQECSLVQLRHTVPLDSMYKQYWYRSGLNASMKTDLQDIVESIERRTVLGAGDIVLDIGCNDGTLFDYYKAGDSLVKIGYDPALNLAEEVSQRDIFFINDYFSADWILERFGYQSVKVITAIAMFYDLPDPNWFLQEIKKILAHDGIFVVQFTDLLSMLKLNAFDNICHEHLEYYSLDVLRWLMRKNGLRIFHVEYNKVNGGSIRAYIEHDNNLPNAASVLNAARAEYQYFKQFNNPLVAFGKRVAEIKEIVLHYLWNARNEGGITEIHTLAASTKGNTLLQYFGITDKIIPYAAEINSEKFGLVTVGSNISILSEEESIKRKPEIYVVLPWHFEDTFTKFLQRIDIHPKPLLLFPLPEPRIYYREDSGVYTWTSLRNLPRL
jgi:SAM-dependent methyltransferase